MSKNVKKIVTMVVSIAIIAVTGLGAGAFAHTVDYPDQDSIAAEVDVPVTEPVAQEEKESDTLISEDVADESVPASTEEEISKDIPDDADENEEAAVTAKPEVKKRKTAAAEDFVDWNYVAENSNQNQAHETYVNGGESKASEQPVVQEPETVIKGDINLDNISLDSEAVSGNVEQNNSVQSEIGADVMNEPASTDASAQISAPAETDQNIEQNVNFSGGAVQESVSQTGGTSEVCAVNESTSTDASTQISAPAENNQNTSQNTNSSSGGEEFVQVALDAGEGDMADGIWTPPII